MPESDTDDGFILVKPRKKCRTDESTIFDQPSRVYMQYDREIVNKLIVQTLGRYKPIGIFLYGSYARNQQNPHDIDILVIWRRNSKMEIPENIVEIRDELAAVLKFPVDLVSMMYTGNFQNFDSRCQCFIEDNVMADAIPLLPKTYKDMIQQSVFFGKCH